MKPKIIISLLTIFAISISNVFWMFTIWEEYSWNNIASRTALDAAATARKATLASWTTFDLLSFGTWASDISTVWVSQFFAWQQPVYVSLRDMFDITSGSLWTLSTSTITLEASTTLQDGSPKPQSLYTTSAPHRLYWNELGGSWTSRNAIMLEFLSWVWWFGWWFGDLETRTIWWATAEIRLLSSTWTYITWSIITPSVADQTLCGSPINDSFAWCWNKTSRFIWFDNSIWLDVRYMLVIVWDDDITTWTDNGFTEHLSFLWGFSTPAPRCWDSLIQWIEQCDAWTWNLSTCTPWYWSSCSYCSMSCENVTLTGWICGDWVMQSLEQCDDSNTNNWDWCSTSCEYEAPVCWLTWASCLLWAISWDNLNMTCSQTRQRQCVNGTLSTSCNSSNPVCPVVPVITVPVVPWWSTFVQLSAPEIKVVYHDSSDLPKSSSLQELPIQEQQQISRNFEHIDSKLPSLDNNTAWKNMKTSPLFVALPATWATE